MRITNGLIADHILENLQNNMSKVADLQKELSSGKKFEKPSDDPVGISRAMRVNALISKDDQYMKNLDNLSPVLQATDSTLQQVVTQMNSATTLMKQYDNFSVQEGNKDLLANNMDEILNSILDLANTSFDGKYIFGGYNTSTKPFIVENGKIRYQGTDDSLKTMISDTETVDMSVSGNNIFTTHQILGNSIISNKDSNIEEPSTNQFQITVGTAAPITVTVGATTTDISLQDIADAINHSGAEVKAYIKETTGGYKLKLVSNFVGGDGQISLQDIAADGILEKVGLIDNTNSIVGTQNNYNTGVLDQLLAVKNKMLAGDSNISQEEQNIKDGYQNILMNQGKIGIMTQSADNRKQLMEDTKINRQEQLSSIQDIDYAEVMTELNREMMAYQAAIQSGARIMTPTLMDYIK
ncbi:MAG: flagellar hook-associated protein FlgL [Candidatus Margulisbacteria bacterium]|nr:flagellar hook-associated protein FlgL [Candidatus Margulisiibacteriota bacterium]